MKYKIWSCFELDQENKRRHYKPREPKRKRAQQATAGAKDNRVLRVGLLSGGIVLGVCAVL